MHVGACSGLQPASIPPSLLAETQSFPQASLALQSCFTWADLASARCCGGVLRVLESSSLCLVACPVHPCHEMHAPRRRPCRFWRIPCPLALTRGSLLVEAKLSALWIGPQSSFLMSASAEIFPRPATNSCETIRSILQSVTRSLHDIFHRHLMLL
ncbi:hypothetical protein BDW62DRAFT_190597 [Aspergillus aurantiobrunneus]